MADTTTTSPTSSRMYSPATGILRTPTSADTAPDMLFAAAQQFQQLGFLAYGTNYFLVVIPFDNRGTLFYREQWYHTAGDSDLL